MKKTLVSIIATIGIIFSMVLSVSADALSFTRVETENNAPVTVLSRNAFEAKKTLTGASLGAQDALTGISDVFVAEDGYIYLLCGETSKIVKLNSDYTLNREIAFIDADGMPVEFKGAEGIFVDTDGTMYLADTQNSRIIITDAKGNCLRYLEQPQADIIPEDFIYNPIKVLRNDEGYTYILSRGCYYGTIVYSPNGEFTGFMGANTVAATVLDAISNFFKKLTTNERKQAASIKNLPYSFVDFAVDKEGYIVTCTGSTNVNTNGTGQIRRVNNAGNNILFKTYANGESVQSTAYNFLEKKIIKKQGENQIQNIVSVDVDASGYIYALDKTFGFIYVYDGDCNNLIAFGGLGDQLGSFTDPVALAVTETGVLVVDKKKSAVTVFEVTDFGKKLFSAQSLYLQCEYTASEPLWNEILQEDRSNQPAYRGLSMISYNNGDYKQALQLAKLGYDYSVYEMAYQKLLTGFIADHFGWLMLALVVLIGGVVAAVVLTKKRRAVLIANPKIRTVLNVGFHPFNAFDEVKYNGRGSMLIAVILAILLYIAIALQSTGTGFLFQKQSLKEYNAIYTFLKTIGLLVLWTVGNWLVCTLTSGIGKLREIFIATVYALVPYILWNFIATALTWVLPLSGEGFISGFNTVVLIYTFFLLSVAMMKIHDINFFGFLLTAVITILAMLFVSFIIFMIIILLQQFWNMVMAVFTEAFYR